MLDDARELLEAFVRIAHERIGLQATSPIVLLSETWLARASAPSGLNDAQRAIRRTGIGASEVPMILGESPHGNAIDVFLRKVGLAEDKPTEAKALGNLLEDGIASWYERATGSKCARIDTTLRHRDCPVVLATPDRWVNGRQKIAQIKLVGHWMAKHWEGERPPDYVLCQVQQEMEVADVELCDVVALIGGTDPRIYQVERDCEMGAALVEVSRSFWQNHVEPRIPPPLDGGESARRMLRALHPTHTPALVIDATGEALAIGDRLCVARRERLSVEREEALLEQRLQQIMGNAEKIRSERWHATWKTNSAGTRVFRFTDHEEDQRGKAA